MKEKSYTSTPAMGRTAITEPQCLYKGALYLTVSPCHIKGDELRTTWWAELLTCKRRTSSVCVIKHHTKKAFGGGGEDMAVHSCQGTRQWWMGRFTPPPGSLLPGNSQWYPLNARLAAHQSQLERFRKENISSIGDKCVYQRDRVGHPGIRERIILKLPLKVNAGW
jgi:hypothetical protein